MGILGIIKSVKKGPKKNIVIVTDDNRSDRLKKHSERFKGHLAFLQKEYNLENICIGKEIKSNPDLIILDFKTIYNEGEKNEANYEKVKEIMNKYEKGVFIQTYKVKSHLKMSPCEIQDILKETKVNAYLWFNKFEDAYLKMGTPNKEEEDKVNDGFRNEVSKFIELILNYKDLEQILEQIKKPSYNPKNLYILNKDKYPQPKT